MASPRPSSPDFHDKKHTIFTRNNVKTAVRDVRDTDSLGWWLGVPGKRQKEIQSQFRENPGRQLEEFVNYFIDHDPLVSWRRVIVSVEMSGEREVAENIRHLAEAVTDPTLTINNLLLVTSSVKDWMKLGDYEYGLGVPQTVLYETLSNRAMTEEDKKTVMLQYFLNNVPMASWQRVAGVLYYGKEETAIQAVKKFLRDSPDPSLNAVNLSTVLDKMSDGLWNTFGRFVNMPRSETNRIKEQHTSARECKQALIHSFLSSHPAPSWTLVAWALYMTEWVQGEGSCLRALDLLQQLFPTGKFPHIRGADIIAQIKLEITPDQPLDYHWNSHGFKVHIPAGAINGDRETVTLCIQASLSGDYQLPDDGILVSGVYWLSLHPYVKFSKKVAITIQHCASDDDPALSFITARCTQQSLPYTFKNLPGGYFSQSGHRTIEVNSFSAFALFGTKKWYAFCTYYLPDEAPNVCGVHITVTPNLELHLKEVDKKYAGNKKGLELQARIINERVSLDVREPKIGIPTTAWEKDGWELTPLMHLTLEKQCLENYKPGRLIPYFAIGLKLMEGSPHQTLVQQVIFTGVEEPAKFLSIIRRPIPAVSPTSEFTHSSATPTASSTTTPGHRDNLISDIHLVEIARDHFTQWEQLRPFLGLNMPQEEAIRITYQMDYGMQKLKCLEVWKEVKGDGATYQALISAAKEAKHQFLADAVESICHSSTAAVGRSPNIVEHIRALQEESAEQPSNSGVRDKDIEAASTGEGAEPRQRKKEQKQISQIDNSDDARETEMLSNPNPQHPPGPDLWKKLLLCLILTFIAVPIILLYYSLS